MNFEGIKSILSSKTVGVAGCGGLGSNSAVALARVHVGTLIIADFDIIIESNLNRQYFFYKQIGQKKAFALKENIEAINPLTTVIAHDCTLNSKNIPEIFSSCDIVIEAFDKAEMKKMIIETMANNLPNIPLIVGLGMAGFGNFNLIKLQQFDNLYICGDGLTEIADNIPPIAPRVGIVSNLQADTAINILLKRS